MDSHRLPGCVRIDHRLGSVSDRPLTVGSTVEADGADLRTAFGPVLRSYRLGPAARAFWEAPGGRLGQTQPPSSIKCKDSS